MTTHKHKILSLIILTISHLNCYANTLIRVLCSIDSFENCDVFSLMDSVNKLQTFLLWLSAQIRPLFAAKYSGASIGTSDLCVCQRPNSLCFYPFVCYPFYFNLFFIFLNAPRQLRRHLFIIKTPLDGFLFALQSVSPQDRRGVKTSTYTE